MTAILGISAFYHDSAAALVLDGKLIAAAQEERFTRRKHDASFPTHAIDYCLKEAGLSPSDLDHVAFYEKPLTKFDRLLETFLAHAPRGFWAFHSAIPSWLKEKLHLRSLINKQLGRRRREAIVFPEHHESHAASAFYPSPFERAAILTLDGVGEWATTTMGIGEGHDVRLTHEIHFPHSLGLLYSAFTSHCGFEVNDGEYKLMGLAPYGEPVFREQILKHLIDLKPDGSFRLNTDYFRFGYGSRMTNRRFDNLFDGSARIPESPIEQRHKDMAASVQAVIEEAVLLLAAEVHRRTGLDDLVMAGGVALNGVANGRLLREGPFQRLWVQPAAGDAGGAIGAALLVWHKLLGQRRVVTSIDSQSNSLLGPRFTSEEVRKLLDGSGISYRRIEQRGELLDWTASKLAEGQVIGWFQGRMEFGPRALGSRSILADPRRPEMRSLVNEKIKFREQFRPFAPAVLADYATDWFDLPRGHASPYMLLVAQVTASHQGEISAVTHIDGSARVQTVDAEHHPDFFNLIEAFHRRTGCPVVLNTSFNVRGEPIVCSPEDALRCFQGTGIDVLVMEDCLIEKSRRENTNAMV